MDGLGNWIFETPVLMPFLKVSRSRKLTDITLLAPAVSLSCQPNTLVFSLYMPDLFAVAWTHDFGSGRTEAVCCADDWISEAIQDMMSH